MMLEAARTNPRTRAAVLKLIGEKVTREVDKQRLAPLIAELEALPQGGDDARPPAQF